MLPAYNTVEKTDLFYQGPVGSLDLLAQPCPLSSPFTVLMDMMPMDFLSLTASDFTMAVPFLRFNLCG